MKVDIADGQAVYEYPPWGLEFRVLFTITPQANTCTVTLYNLSRKTLSQLKRGLPVRVYAGYREHEVGLVFAGILDRWDTRYSGPDKLTNLHVVDGKDSVLSARANKTWPKGTPCAAVVEDLFGMAGLRVGAIEIKGRAVYDRPVSFPATYTVARALDQVLADVELKTGTPHTWYVDLGYGFFLPRDTQYSAATVEVTPQTGLIESPEQLNALPEDIAGTQAEPRQWRIRTVFNFRIAANVKLVVRSHRLDGEFRVVSGEHICTMKERFETDVVADEIRVTLKEFDYITSDERTKAPLPGIGGEEGSDGGAG